MIEPTGCLALALLVFTDARCLLEEFAARVFAVGEEVVYHAERDDGVAIAAHACVHEQCGDVLEAAGHVVEAVLALTRAVEYARDRHRAVLGR